MIKVLLHSSNMAPLVLVTVDGSPRIEETELEVGPGEEREVEAVPK